MIYRNVIGAILAVTLCIIGGSSAMAQRHGGFGGGGFGSGGFRGGSGSAGMTPGFARGGSRFGPGVFRGFGDFRGDRDAFRRRRFDDFVFFGDFGDPFFYYPYAYYGYYPNDYNSYGYGSYDQPAYQRSAGYAGSLVEQVQLRLAYAGYYHAAIDGVSGNATQTAIREYERAHRLPVDGQIRERLLTTMGVG